MPTTIERDVESKPRSFPIARLDLDEEVRQMRASPKTHGHLAKTLLHGPDIRLVLMILDHGKQLPAHSANGSLTIQTLAGLVIVTLLESSYDLGPGQMLSIERGVSHALVAIEDSAILLTIAWSA